MSSVDFFVFSVCVLFRVVLLVIVDVLLSLGCFAGRVGFGDYGLGWWFGGLFIAAFWV